MANKSRRAAVARPSAESTPAAAGAHRMLIAAVVVLVPLFYLSLSCFKRSLIDDAFITLQYAATLRHHGHWGFFADRITNTATSPLDVWLTAFVGLFTSDMVDAAIWLAAAEYAALAVVLALLSRRLFGGGYWAAVAFVGIAANPLLLSSLGLETMLYTVLLVTSLYLLVFRRWLVLAVVLALLTLARPDGAVLFAVMVFFIDPAGDGTKAAQGRRALEASGRWRLRARFTAVYLLCLLPWYVFSWVYLGSALPDTFFLKVANPWGRYGFASGLCLYLRRYPLQTLSSFALVPFVPFAVLNRSREGARVLRVLAWFAAAYYAAYALMEVGPYHWYFAPLAASGALMGSFGLASAYSRARAPVARAVLCAAPLLAVVGVSVFFLRADSFPPTEAPIHTNWATRDQYEEIALWLRDHLGPGERIKLQGEIGTMAFYSRRQLMEAFSCRREADWLLRRFEGSGWLARNLAKINFLWYDAGPPCGPYSYYLVSAPRPLSDEEIGRPPLKRWRISSTWVREGTVALLR